MTRPSTIDLDGRRYLWRDIVERRKKQIAEHRKAQGNQPALFELKDDARPISERTVAGRYVEPTLFAWSNDRPTSADDKVLS